MLILHVCGFNILFSFFQREGKGRRKGNINLWLPLARPLLGTWPTTQACALTGNPTGDPLFCRGTQSTETHQPGHVCVF